VVLSWLGGGKQPANVSDLIARKKYGKAVDLLMAQFRQGSRDPRLRIQLADVLVLEGKGAKAVPILIGVADEFAREGFAAKAIATLKKIEKIEPGRSDVEQRLAGLIKQRHDAPITLGARLKTLPELGIDEIGYEPSARDAEAARPITEGGSPAQPPAPAAEAPVAAREAAPAPTDAELLEFAGLLDEEDEAAPSEAPLKSPLFTDFTEEELVAVIHGLRLLSFEPGDIIRTEGEPGDSLFVLTTGFVKAFVRNPAGRHIQVREISEGDFFGEISILTGKPRTATITAGSHCELLELDRPTLDSISKSHPHVLQVLQDFYQQRSNSAQESRARGTSFGEGRGRSEPEPTSP
jgi:Cyclic nucleotide-binding domain